MLIQPDWGLNLGVVDYAGSGSKSAGEVSARLTKELDSSNPKVVILALHLMETLVKNGSFTVHASLSGKWAGWCNVGRFVGGLSRLPC